ncbi:hypothetical protein BDQ12DRAFT_493312 [Crucibulum laeve]|uniref:Uncharacterized protein n=1 Tax=Crucibulum laeve TaxID=68775 RepID=A0A5C3M905_9AGAR|nr:hypothetical protein BDQ12DRAFT_493312 [Crucibulum laeve]
MFSGFSRSKKAGRPSDNFNSNGPYHAFQYPDPIQSSEPRYGPIPQVPPRPAQFPGAPGPGPSYGGHHQGGVASYSGGGNFSYTPPPPVDAYGTQPHQHHYYQQPPQPQQPRPAPSQSRVTRSRSNGMTTDVLKRLLLNQRVEVHLGTGGWAMGIIVGILEVCHKFAGLGYEVRYQASDGRPETEVFPNDPNHIKPIQ